MTFLITLPIPLVFLHWKQDAAIYESWTHKKRVKKTGITKDKILLLALSRHASRSQRVFKTMRCSRFRLQVSITKRNAASKTVSKGVQYGLCFHFVDMATLRSGPQDPSIELQISGATSLSRFQAEPLPVLTTLDHAGPRRISVDMTQHGQIVLIGLDRKRLESSWPEVPTTFAVSKMRANVDVMSHGILRLCRQIDGFGEGLM